MEMIPVPTGSPVKFIVPIEPVPVPRMVAQPSITFTPDQFRPDTRTVQPAVDRIYHAVEVDRIPVPVFRKTPRVGGELLRTITDPKVLLTFVVTARGTVENITVVQAASAEYGRIVAEAVAEWRFEPAMKGGRRVRCFVLQSVSVIGSRGDSPFTAH
jgi:TonB family protein